jgi:uncharacterized GH25 family protein
MHRPLILLLVALTAVFAVWLLWSQPDVKPIQVDDPVAEDSDESVAERELADVNPSNTDTPGRQSSDVELPKLNDLIPDQLADAFFDKETKTVRGQVVRDGVGVSGAKVRVYESGKFEWYQGDDIPEPMMEVDCDVSGRYEVIVPRQDFCLVAVHQNLGGLEFATVDEDAQEITEGVDLTVYPLHMSRGVVRSGLAAVAKASVRIRLRDYWNLAHVGETWGIGYKPIQFPTTESAADGSFNVQVPEGEFFISAKHDELGEGTKNTDVPDSALVEISLAVKKEVDFTFHGVVLDPSGKTVANADVKAVPLNEATESNANGVFELAKVKRNQFLGAFAVAWKLGFAPSFIKLDFENTEQLVVVYLQAATEISGILLDANDQPIPGAEIVLDGETNEIFQNNSSHPESLLGSFQDPPSKLPLNRAKTDDAGRFHFRHLPQGEYRLTYFSKTDLWSSDAAVSALTMANSGQMDVVMKVGDFDGLEVRFSGRVYHRYTGDAIPHADVSINLVQRMGAGGWSAGRVANEISSDTGEYSMPALEAAEYYLTCKVNGFSKRTTELKNFEPGAYSVDLDLVPERKLELLVLDVKGNPVPKASVKVRDQAGGNVLIALSPNSSRSPAPLDDKGRITMFGLPGELVSVSLISQKGANLGTKQFDLTLPGPHKQEIRLDQLVTNDGQRVVLNFLDDTGAEVSDISDDPNSALLIQAFDLQNVLVFQEKIWRVDDVWTTHHFGEITPKSNQDVHMYLPLSGARIVVTADGYQSKELQVHARAKENANTRQKLNVVLER